MATIVHATKIPPIIMAPIPVKINSNNIEKQKTTIDAIAIPQTSWTCYAEYLLFFTTVRLVCLRKIFY